MKQFILIGLIILGFQAHANITFGSDNDCDYNTNQYTLQQVIDLHIPGEIRVTNQQTFYENIEINSSILLKGGYTNCTNANANIATGKTVIDGGGANSVIEINGFTQKGYVDLIRLHIKNGAGLGSNFGGGLTIIDPNNVAVVVKLHSSLIANNTGDYGGGIALIGGLVDLALIDSVVLNNEATKNGGGIYCYGGFVSVGVDSGVILNDAFNSSSSYGNGGGIYASNGCFVQVLSGTQGSIFDFRGVAANSASNNGGGIYANNAAYIRLTSSNRKEVINVNGNTADIDQNGSGTGGGIHLSGNGTKAELLGALITNNEAQHGGGIAVTHGATLMVGKLNGDCWNQQKCNEISDNRTATNGGFGGAVYLFRGHADIQSAFIHGNRADNGVVMYADDSSTAKLRSSYVYDNGANAAEGWDDIFNFRFTNSGLILNHVTIANNRVSGASIRQNGGFYSYTNSIIKEPHVGLGANITNIIGTENCLLLDDDTGFDHLTHSLVANPYFIDEANHDYRLSALSYAIDMCGEDAHTLPTDNDGEAMWDDPNYNNDQGIRDAGADETYVGDVIFKSAF